MPDYSRVGVPIERKDWTREDLDRHRFSIPRAHKPKWLEVAMYMCRSTRPWKIWTTGSRKSCSTYLYAECYGVIVCIRFSDHPSHATRPARGCHAYFDGSEMSANQAYKKAKQQVDERPASVPLQTIKKYSIQKENNATPNY